MPPCLLVTCGVSVFGPTGRSLFVVSSFGRLPCSASCCVANGLAAADALLYVRMDAGSNPRLCGRCVRTCFARQTRRVRLRRTLRVTSGTPYFITQCVRTCLAAADALLYVRMDAGSDPRLCGWCVRTCSVQRTRYVRLRRTLRVHLGSNARGPCVFPAMRHCGVPARFPRSFPARLSLTNKA
jgi:hypothetical protein